MFSIYLEQFMHFLDMAPAIYFRIVITLVTVKRTSMGRDAVPMSKCHFLSGLRANVG